MSRQQWSSPALADLSRGIEGVLPVHLTRVWSVSENRNETTAEELLAPYRLRGTVVCSDTAGLSRMTRDLPLAVVLKRVAGPKKVLHSLGTGLGGRAVGYWVADNTEMFYPHTIDPADITEAMLEVHKRIDIEIGIGIHTGTFFEIGGGLYGPDADRIEMLSEDFTSGGDTLVTDDARTQLRDDTRFLWRDMPDHGFGKVFYVDGTVQPSTRSFVQGDHRYPIPFDSTFNQLLETLDESRPDDTIAQMQSRWKHTRTVILVERREERPVRSLTQTLNSLLADATFQSACRPILEKHAAEYVIGGRLALAAFPDTAKAIETAQALQREALSKGLVLSVGIDRGQVYLFPMAQGVHEFAGDPVNRASKLAEDLAEPGDLCVTQRALGDVPLPRSEPRTWRISGIELEAHLVPGTRGPA